MHYPNLDDADTVQIFEPGDTMHVGGDDCVLLTVERRFEFESQWLYVFRFVEEGTHYFFAWSGEGDYWPAMHTRTARTVEDALAKAVLADGLEDVFAKEGRELANALEQAIDVYGKARMMALATELLTRAYLRSDDDATDE